MSTFNYSTTFFRVCSAGVELHCNLPPTASIIGCVFLLIITGHEVVVNFAGFSGFWHLAFNSPSLYLHNLQNFKKFVEQVGHNVEHVVSALIAPI